MIRQIRFFSAILSLMLVWGASSAHAQMTVSVDNISGTSGQTVFVPVNLGNVPGTGFSSFRFDVSISNNNLTFNGHLSTGTLSSQAGWSVQSNDSNALNNPGRVGGFASANDAITSDGVLVLLSFTINGTDGGSVVELQGMQFTQGGTVAHTPALPITQLVISNPPVATDDAYAVDEGGNLVVAAGQGVLQNDTDADGDPLTASLGTDVSNGTLSLAADGSFTYTHDGSETTTDSFTYTVSDGSNVDTGTVTITVNPVNDPPQFTATLSSQTVDENDIVVFDFNATDAEGDVLTFAIVSGPGQINAETGLFTWLAAPSGSFNIVVGVSDGTTAVTSPVAAIEVREIKQYQTLLSGYHVASLVESGASGSVTVTHNVGANQISIEGSFANLGSSFASAALGIGTLDDAGTVVVPLLAGFTDPAFRTGEISASSNTIDLSSITYPQGVTEASFKSALASGGVFVSIASLSNLTGEVRGLLREGTNTAPSVLSVSAPNAVTTDGEPTAELISVTWAGSPVDAQSDPTRLVLEVSGSSTFNTIVDAMDVSVTTGSGVAFTTAWAAELYDELTGRQPGNILVGGTVTAHMRLTSTDGAALSAGSGHAIDITRASVTDTEGNELPAEFVLRGNYPNPFNPTTTISFDLPETADVQVDVLDLLGRTMISVPVQSLSAGTNRSISIDAADLTSGIYMYRVLARGASSTWVKSGTMTLIK